MSAANLARAGEPRTFAIGPDAFLLDGKPIQLISGEMHPARIPPEYWRQRLQMARAMGLNAVTIYCFWDIYEPEPGQWNFTGFGDVAGFCRIAQEQGLLVIVRPGPYVCAEWDFGGYPAWLLRTPTMKVRSMDPDYIKAADSYVQHMAGQLAPLQIEKGGPIIMWQVENEYGSYGKDKEYLAHLRDAWKKAGIEVPLFTADGGGRMMANGSIDGALPGLNGGNEENVFKEVGKYRATGPFIVPEFYPGWLDHWGERHSTSGAAGAANGLKKLLDKNVSVNLYMFHGGTNWGGMSGANYSSHYQPQPTSYDYDAPLDEAGRPTKKIFPDASGDREPHRWGCVDSEGAYAEPGDRDSADRADGVGQLFRSSSEPGGGGKSCDDGDAESELWVCAVSEADRQRSRAAQADDSWSGGLRAGVRRWQSGCGLGSAFEAGVGGHHSSRGRNPAAGHSGGRRWPGELWRADSEQP